MHQTNDTIGPYTLVRTLGKGSLGEVWLAADNESIIRDFVALKLPIGGEIDPEVIREESGLWLKASGHPNIVPILDVREYDSQIAIVMEYVEGRSLGEVLSDHSGLASSTEWAINITLGILAGLEHLHSLQIVHRNIKPSNILLNGPVPRITDYGMSRILQTAAKHGPGEGTSSIPYMAPESFRGIYSGQSDIWSTGVVLYQMLTGVMAFPQEQYAEIMFAICNGDVPPLPATIPERVRIVVARALQRDAIQRFRNVQAMRDVLLAGQASDQFCKPVAAALPDKPISHKPTRLTLQADPYAPLPVVPVNDLQPSKAAFSQITAWDRGDAPLDPSLPSPLALATAQPSVPLPNYSRPFNKPANLIVAQKDHQRKRLLPIGAGLFAAAGLIGVGSFLWMQSHPVAPEFHAVSRSSGPVGRQPVRREPNRLHGQPIGAAARSGHDVQSSHSVQSRRNRDHALAKRHKPNAASARKTDESDSAPPSKLTGAGDIGR